MPHEMIMLCLGSTDWVFGFCLRTIEAIAAAAILLVVVGCNRQSEPFSAEGTQAILSEPVDLEEEKFKQRIDAVLEMTRQRHMRADTQAAWQVLHGALVFGNNLIIRDEQGKLVPALEYLFREGPMEGWNLRPAEKGVHALLESGSKTGQGHKDQWLGYLSLSPAELPVTQPIQVRGREFHLADLLSQAQWECREGMEASWTLMGFSTYLPLDAEWTSSDGEHWTMERLVAMEASRDVNQAACGGTHMLVGLTVAVNRYLESGQDLTGGWKVAEEKIKQAVETARKNQNPSGAFSTNYFIRPGNSPDAKTLIGTTGHTLEFLSYALTDAEIREPWMEHAVVFLCEMLENTRNIDLEAGALYHAAAGLRVYRLRRFGPPPPRRDNLDLAEAPR